MPERLYVGTESFLFLGVLIDTFVDDFPSLLAETLNAARHLFIVLSRLYSDLGQIFIEAHWVFPQSPVVFELLAVFEIFVIVVRFVTQVVIHRCLAVVPIVPSDLLLFRGLLACLVLRQLALSLRYLLLAGSAPPLRLLRRWHRLIGRSLAEEVVVRFAV